jgi:hypothetical protein
MDHFPQEERIHFLELIGDGLSPGRLSTPGFKTFFMFDEFLGEIGRHPWFLLEKSRPARDSHCQGGKTIDPVKSTYRCRKATIQLPWRCQMMGSTKPLMMNCQSPCTKLVSSH